MEKRSKIAPVDIDRQEAARLYILRKTPKCSLRIGRVLEHTKAYDLVK